MPKGKRMRFDDRKMMEQMLQEGKSKEEIARAVGVSLTTIYNELRRCTEGKYSAEKAQAAL